MSVAQRVGRFNERVSWELRLIALLAAGIGLGLVVARTALAALPVYDAVRATLRHGAPDCPWQRVFATARDGERLSALARSIDPTVSVIGHDPRLDIQQVASPERSFWIRRSGSSRSGRDLLVYLLSEHRWMAESSPASTVRNGDVVIDCGAHVGVFVHTALKRGARTVVAVEPEPVNVECLRRNFAREIEAGQVIVVPKGVWSAETNLALSLGVENSGMNSMVMEERGAKLQVAVTTIDKLVRELGLPRVDYIKMDIEGAEREALAGALATLREFRPRLMLDSYHLPDDTRVLPAIIRRAHADYSLSCGPCEIRGDQLVPHVMFYR
ncbi:MAG: FkbM family methyltransferase [Bryobacterales bacterium]|nr:FkbM family methyltransferase [Bryobacterales bacterium]